LAVKIVRQPKKIALIGACSSAAAFLPGTEKAPAALRAAGLVEKLKNIGYDVVDLGDCAPRLFADDEEHRRARNLPADRRGHVKRHALAKDDGDAGLAARRDDDLTGRSRGGRAAAPLGERARRVRRRD